jgi:hypothetical protein
VAAVQQAREFVALRVFPFIAVSKIASWMSREYRPYIAALPTTAAKRSGLSISILRVSHYGHERQPVSGVPLPSLRKETSVMGVFTKDIKTMEDLLVHGLQDIHYAEQQILNRCRR